MLYHILLSLLLTVSSISADRCHLDWSCSPLNSRFVLAQLSNISSAAQCRTKCREDQHCNFFTFYNWSSPGLADTCHLFTRCVRRRGCRGCLSGPRDCEARCEVP